VAANESGPLLERRDRGPGPALLELGEVHKRYGGVHALRGASLAIPSGGAVHGLIGENGSGKSTMLAVLSGQVRPDSGFIRVNGSPVVFQTPLDALDRGIAMVSQEIAVAPHLSVAENVLLGRRLVRTTRGIDWGATYDKALAVLGQLGLDFDPRRAVGTLRPDQRQMVEIARALSIQARVLVLDEPTSSLTDDEVQSLFTVIRQLKTAGVSTILVTHRLPELFQICDELTVLRDGQTVSSGPAHGYDAGSLVSAMVGSSRLTPEMKPRGTRRGADEEVLRVADFSVGPAVSNVDLRVRRGEIVGLSGLVGAGRSELLEAVFGLRPHTGLMTMLGQAVARSDARESIALGMGFLPPDRKTQGVILSMSVSDNMLMVAHHRRPRLARPRWRRDAPVAQRMFADLNVHGAGTNALVGTLSGGNQQKVALGKWLVDPPRLLLLDEPTRGVDVASKAEIHQILADLASRGVALLVSSSENDELLALCDRLVVMSRGRVVSDIVRSQTDEAMLARLSGGHV